MVRYLDDTDYSPVIREEIKAILTIAGEDALIRAEEFAIGEILSYLGRYDTSLLFTTEHKKPFWSMMVVDVALYNLYAQHPNRMTQIRFDRYNKHIEYLEKVGKKEIVPDMPIPQEPEPTIPGAMKWIERKKLNQW